MDRLETAKAFTNAFYGNGEEFCLYLKTDESYDKIREKEQEFEQETDYIKRKQIDEQIQELQRKFRGKSNAYQLREGFERSRVYKEDVGSFVERFSFYQRMNAQRFAPCLHINSGYKFELDERTGILKPRSVCEFITKINAQFFECDHTNIDKQREIISALPIKPSIVVKTGRSLHVYFLLHRIEGEDRNNEAVLRFKGIQKGIGNWIFNNFGEKTDSAMSNLNRPMRIPGFDYAKLDEPFQVRIETIDCSLRYSQLHICQAFGIDVDKIQLDVRTMVMREYNAADDSIRELIKKHLYEEGYASYDYGRKIHCHCCHTDHDDKHPSAVVYLDSMNHFCHECGNTPIEEIAEELGWKDVLGAFKKCNVVLNKTADMAEFALKYGIRF